jgi:hypothetical protein
MKEAMEYHWNIMLAHHVAGMGLVYYKDIGSKACDLFQIIVNRKGVRKILPVPAQVCLLRLQRAPISFVISVHPVVCPHVSTWLALARFS